MNYTEHKKHFGNAYRTGTDAWTHQPTIKEGSKLIEKLSPGMFILDIGSGRGFFAKYLAEIGFQVIGIDFEGDIVKKTNGNIADWNLKGKLKFIEADALKMPLPDSGFDAVYDSGLFETLHKEDWETYATEVSRVLKPGGFYLNVSLSRETQQFFEFIPKKDATGELEKYGIHYHFFEKSEIANIFKGKFGVVSQEKEIAKTDEKIVLLETLFQKPK